MVMHMEARAWEWVWATLNYIMANPHTAASYPTQEFCQRLLCVGQNLHERTFGKNVFCQWNNETYPKKWEHADSIHSNLNKICNSTHRVVPLPYHWLVHVPCIQLTGWERHVQSTMDNFSGTGTFGFGWRLLDHFKRDMKCLGREAAASLYAAPVMLPHTIPKIKTYLHV